MFLSNNMWLNYLWIPNDFQFLVPNTNICWMNELYFASILQLIGEKAPMQNILMGCQIYIIIRII